MRLKQITKKTKFDTEFNLMVHENRVMVKYKPTFNEEYVLITDFIEKNRLTDHEKIVLMNGVHDLGFKLSLKPIIRKI